MIGNIFFTSLVIFILFILFIIANQEELGKLSSKKKRVFNFILNIPIYTMIGCIIAWIWS